MPAQEVLLILFVRLALIQVSCGSPAAPSTSCLRYRRYFFKPACPDSKVLTISDESGCALAASMSGPESAAVMTSSGGKSCHVTAALCPRYQLCSADCSSVLMPMGLTALKHVVMSVKRGCGHKVWDVLNTLPAHADHAVQPAHPEAAVLPDVFRSSLLDNVQRLISGLVYKHFVVQLYKGSAVVVRLVFDVGSASSSLDKLNWFRKERLVESWPVSNLTAMSTNLFSIEGVTNSPNDRRFFINFSYGGCPVDRGFMVVLDTKDDVCAMYRFTSPIPRIVYSSDPWNSMESTLQDADYIAIMVR